MEKITIEVEDYSKVSDGYHTIQELYDHRIALYIAFCQAKVEHWATLRVGANLGVPAHWECWRSKLHADGTSYDGWFILGMTKGPGTDISYHLPLSYWDATGFAETLERGREWDGHTSADVLERIAKHH